MIISTKIEYITPQLAAKYLEKNFDGNRKVRKTWVRSLALMMRDGKFNSLNGQNRIIFGTDGKMYDGQHRMHAIIESGVTLPFEVCVSDSTENDYATYDYAQVKRAGDLVNLPGANNASAIACRAYAIECGTAPLLSALNGKKVSGTNVSRVDVTEYAMANRDKVIRLTHAAEKMRRALKCGQMTVFGTFIALLEYIGDDLYLEDFIDEMSNSFTEDKTIRALKSMVQSAYLGKKRPTQPWLLGMLLCGYSHYKQGDNTTTLNKPNAFIERYSKMLTQERHERSEENVA